MRNPDSHCFWCENIMQKVGGEWVDNYGDINCRFHPLAFDITTLKSTNEKAPHQEFPEVHLMIRAHYKMIQKETRRASLRLVRTGATDTSVAAADSINVSKLEEVILKAIREAGERGLTADELRSQFPSLSYSSVTARPASLKEKGLIVDSGRRRIGKSGRQQAVLVAI